MAGTSHIAAIAADTYRRRQVAVDFRAADSEGRRMVDSTAVLREVASTGPDTSERAVHMEGAAVENGCIRTIYVRNEDCAFLFNVSRQ